MGTRLAPADAWVGAGACVTCALGTGPAPSASSTTSPPVGCATSATPPEVGTSVGVYVVGGKRWWWWWYCCWYWVSSVGVVVAAVGGVTWTGVAGVSVTQCVCGVAEHPHTALHYCVAGSGAAQVSSVW